MYSPLAMRQGHFAGTVLLTAFVAACGGGNKPATLPTTGDSSGGTSTGGASDADAGPTTTTTTTLGNNGDLQGAKLQSSSTQIYGSDAGATPSGGSGGAHTPDPGRSQKDIQAMILARRDDARACYDAGLKQHPGIEGDLVIQWTIDPKGAVTAISEDTSRSQITEPGVVACIVKIIQSIQFAASPGGFESKAYYPFNFHPHNSQKQGQ